MKRKKIKPHYLNPDWKYVPALSTDVGKRIRDEIARLKKLREAEPQSKVTVMRRKGP